MEQGASSMPHIAERNSAALPQESSAAMERLLSDLNEEERLLVCLLRRGVRMSEAEMQHLNKVFLRLINNRVNVDNDKSDQTQNIPASMNRRASTAAVDAILSDFDSSHSVSNNIDNHLYDLQARRLSLFGGLSTAEEIHGRRGSFDSLAGDLLRRTSLDLLISDFHTQQRRLSNSSFGRRNSFTQLLGQESLFQDPISESPNVPVESHEMEQMMDDSVAMNGLLSVPNAHPRTHSLQFNKFYTEGQNSQNSRLPTNVLESITGSDTRDNSISIRNGNNLSTKQVLRSSNRGTDKDYSTLSTQELHQKDNAPIPEIVKTFQCTMTASQKSQQDIQSWDKKMGLKRSHSSTMTKTTQSRNKLRKLFENEAILANIC